MSSFKAVLDAYVLFPAAPRDTLLRAGRAGLYRVQFSDDILEEVRRNHVEKGMPVDKAQRLVDTMRQSFLYATVTEYQSLIPAMTNREKDRHVLAAAVISEAQVIVTQNIKDFPPESLTPYKIEAQTIDRFLVNLFYLNPEMMVQTIIRQAKALRNPARTLMQVLETLALHAPNFVRLVRREIDTSVISKYDLDKLS